MSDESLPIVPLGGSQLARHGSGSGRILDDMVSSALNTSQKEGVLIPRHRIGDIEFCEPDYRQMLHWAEDLNISPERLLGELLEDELTGCVSGRWLNPYSLNTQIVEGRIKQLLWNTRKLPIFSFDLGDEIQLESLALVGGYPSLTPPPWIDSRYFEKHIDRRLVKKTSFSHPVDSSLESEVYTTDFSVLDLPHLKRLVTIRTRLKNLWPQNLHSLEEFTCKGHNLVGILGIYHVEENLELPATQISILDCSNSSDSWGCHAIDLTSFPFIKWLDCSSCGLDRLIPQSATLEKLFCRENELLELDLSLCCSLEEMYCDYNHLRKLDLTPAPELKQLSCKGNMLEELDIRPLQHLESLDYDRDRTRLIQRPDQSF